MFPLSYLMLLGFFGLFVCFLKSKALQLNDETLIWVKSHSGKIAQVNKGCTLSQNLNQGS